jgi:hypothetical protein
MLGLLLAVGGCVPGPTAAPNHWMSRFRSMWLPPGQEAVQIEMAVVQDSLLNNYLTDGLWKEVDEQVLRIEQRPELAANGFRVGVLADRVSAPLKTLLLSKEHADRPRRIAALPGHELYWPLGCIKPVCAVNITQDGETVSVDMENAEFGLAVRLSTTPDGITHFHAEPYVRHGTDQWQAKPDRQKGDWAVKNGRPEERYPHLAMGFDLGPGEYLVIGGWHDRTNALGQHCFYDFPAGKQRVLILRGVPANDVPNEVLAGTGPMPLAVQSMLSKPLPAKANTAVHRGQKPEDGGVRCPNR